MSAKPKKKAPPSVEELIRRHSKARVLHAHPVGFWETKINGKCELTNHDVMDSMVRQYA